MGGGVGLGGHVSHRVIGESAQIAMPECGIGFVPDVGGSLLLARAPGRLGAYLGLTAARMGPGDALHAGFADLFVPEARWEALKSELAKTGSIAALDAEAQPAPESPLATAQSEIDQLFASDSLPEIKAALDGAQGEIAERAAKAVDRNAPLSMALTLAMLARLRAAEADIRSALKQEFRVSHRIVDRLFGEVGRTHPRQLREELRHGHAVALQQDASHARIGIAGGAGARAQPRGRIQPAPITRRCRQPSNPPDTARGGEPRLPPRREVAPVDRGSQTGCLRCQ